MTDQAPVLTRDNDLLWRDMGAEYMRLVPGALQGRAFDGEYTRLCEQEIRLRTGRRHAFMCHSGSAALQLAMLALDVGPGTEVICPNYGYVASVNQVSVVGATPRFVEVDRWGHIDADLVEREIRPETKAIVVAGLYGDNPDLARLAQIAKRHGIRLINDAAQSNFGEHAGGRQDQYGDVVCYSFGNNKLCSTFITYGCIATDDATLADRLRLMRTHGKAGRDHPIAHVGINSQPHEDKCLQVWLALQRVDGWIQRRQEIGRRYDTAFSAAGVDYRSVAPNNTSVRSKYAVFFRDRDRAHDLLLAEGIHTEKHYRDNFGQGVLAVHPLEHTPNTTHYNRHSLSIPMQAYLTDSQVERVIGAVIQQSDREGADPFKYTHD